MASTARRWTPGPCARTSGRLPPSTPATSPTRSSPSTWPAAATSATAIFAIDEHPRRDTRPGEAGLAEAAAPRDRGLQHHRRQRLRAQRRGSGARSRRPGARRRRRPGDVRHRAGLGFGGRGARADRPARPSSPSPRPSTGRAWPSMTSPSGRSTRRSPRCAWGRPASSASTKASSTWLGSGCSLGHPVAMTGARMLISLVHELRHGGGSGVAAMCAGGGMATALVLDVEAPT